MVSTPRARPATSWTRRLLALALGSAVAAAGLLAAEWQIRKDEGGVTVFVADPVGLKFAYAPGQGERGRGWELQRPPVPKVKDTRRVVFVGDSVTFGLKVRPFEAWPDVATDWLNRQSQAEGQGRIESYNFAMSGYDAEQSATLVQTGLQDWAPDLLVWGVYVNDLQRTWLLYRESKTWPLFVSTTVPASVAFLPGGWDHRLALKSAIWRRFLGARTARVIEANPEFSDDIGLVRSALQQMKAWAANQGIPFAAVALPPHVLADPAACPDSYGGDAARCDLETRRYQQILDELSAQAVPHADALPTLRATGQAAFQPRNGTDPDHPGPDGHRLFAKAAYPLLQHQLGLSEQAPVEPPPVVRERKSSRDYPRPDKP